MVSTVPTGFASANIAALNSEIQNIRFAKLGTVDETTEDLKIKLKTIDGPNKYSICYLNLDSGTDDANFKLNLFTENLPPTVALAPTVDPEMYIDET